MAVDPNIKKKADDIRNKMYGKEVRESLASGLEEMSTDVVETVGRQDEVESQFQDVIENTTDKDVISAPEIIAARNGEANLKTRIDKDYQEVTAQLAQTVRKMEGLEVNVSSVGIYPDGNDYTDKLIDLINTGAILVFPKGEYIVTDELPFKHGQGIRTVGKVVLDGTNFKGADGKAVLRVTNDGDDFTELPRPLNDIKKGDQEIAFSAEHNLSVGDIISLYDNTDFSWLSTRYYYRKGEFAKVVSVNSPNTVVLDNGVFDDYEMQNMNFNVYKMNMGTFSFSGDMDVIQGNSTKGYGILFERVRDFNGTGLTGFLNGGGYAAVCFEQCFNTKYKGNAIQNSLTDSGWDYGLAIVNSQHTVAEGYYTGSRHGVTHTGKDKIGAIVVRDSNIYGTVKTTRGGADTVLAFDSHGNTEDIYFKGSIYGGAVLGGKHNKIEGVVYGNKIGLCVLFNDLKSFNHDLSGVQFITDKNPFDINRAVIDLGGYTAAEGDNALGGKLDFSHISLKAPNARYGVSVRTRNSSFPANEQIDISLEGSVIETSEDGSVDSLAVYIGKFSSEMRGFRFINISNAVLKSIRNSISGYEVLEMPSKKGGGVYETDTTKNAIEVKVTFDAPYPAGYVPNVSVNGIRNLIGTAFPILRIVSITNEGFTFVVNSSDGENFSSSVSTNYFWRAE